MLSTLRENNSIFLNSRLKLWIVFEDLRVQFKEFHNKGPAIRMVHFNALRTFPGKSLSRKDVSRKDVSRKKLCV